MNVNYALGTGLQTSAVTLVGRAHGRDDYDLINETCRAITKIGMITAVALGIAMATGGRLFFSFFSSEEEFIAMGAASAIFIGVISIPQTLKFINNGCLQGMGMMKQSMFCSVIAFTVVNLGSVVLTVFVFHMGIWGVWISTLLCQTSQALMLYYFIKHPGKESSRYEKRVDG
jgi:MATE family multidrug resistance protein